MSRSIRHNVSQFGQYKMENTAEKTEIQLKLENNRIRYNQIKILPRNEKESKIIKKKELR